MRGQTKSHGHAAEKQKTQMEAKKGDVESGLVYCTLAKVVPSQSIKFYVVQFLD